MDWKISETVVIESLRSPAACGLRPRTLGMQLRAKALPQARRPQPGGRRRCSYHRMPMRRRVPPSHKMLELPLDVGQQRARTEAEQIGLQPAIAQLFFHEIQVLERLLGGADAASGLEAHREAGLLEVFADRPHH